MPDFICRPARPEDMEQAFAVFRRSIYDYLFKLSIVTEAERNDPPIASAWLRQGAWVTHLWHSAAENWVAVADAGHVLGWALSVERDAHLELAMFFVDPGQQAKGIGRTLLACAFPAHRGEKRSILATQSPQALKLYLQSGVEFVTTSADFLVNAGPAVTKTDLTFEVSDDIGAVVAIEEQILGLRREVDLRFLIGDRRLWIARRDGEPAGYAFGVPPNRGGADEFPTGLGPIAALRAEDFPALLDHVLASEQEGSELFMTVPMSNRGAVSHLLARGARIDPFYIAVLSNDRSMKLDRYIHTSPCFVL